ncbi:hypothetical protein [Sphingomonas sp. GV3]|uniref:hypothetical protein n=1 Tax=Sphingomonas sp. GV3 TaxID=3040671 RepID=UPI00280B1125|nr:hypothetical protein [Sphingomonas sp. GV3]
MADNIKEDASVRERSLRVVAERFRSWAAEQGILTFQPPDDQFEDRHDSLNDLAETNHAAAASAILNHRKINLIAVNPAKDEILVVTHQKLTKRDIETLPSEAEGGHKFRYIKSHPPQVRLPLSAAGGGSGMALHGAYYTCGSSISVANSVSAGTLGALVRNAAGDLLALTNNHVSGGCCYTDVDFPIVAPGLLDVRPTGHDPFTLGHHLNVASWIAGIPDNVDVTKNIDAATFKIKDETTISSMQRGLFDTPTTTLPLAPGLAVRKVGRTTGDTKGQVIGQVVGFTPVMMDVPQFKGVIYFDDVFLVQGASGQPFSDRGDSGSLVVHTDAAGTTHAVGLLFAGSADGSLTFILPIDKVLAHFGVTLVGGHNV